jgi:6-pyruvoyl-tetrahydropterin synthase related domain
VIDAQATSARANDWRRALLLLALTATAVVMPMFFRGDVSGHDFQFHIASWVDVARQWRQGILFPRWAEWANWGYGEPRFIFYPPASWILGAALGAVLPWTFAPVAYIWLTLVAGGMAMWRLAREWLSPGEAAAAAVFFAVNPYNLLVVYYRSDFAELLAEALFPLLVLGALRVIRDGFPRVPFLALAFAAVWLSNAPAAVIATYSVALLLAVASVLNRSFRPLVRGGAAIAAGFALAGFYILPAAWEQKWVQIAQAVSQNLNVQRNFLFTRAVDPEFLLFNWKVSALALGVMLITGVLAVFVARRRQEFPELWWMFLVLGIVSALLMFSPTYIVWRSLPKLRFVQFPWRWLNPLAIVFAFFTAAARGTRRERVGRRQWMLWIGIVAILAATGTAIASNTWWDSDDATNIAYWVQEGDGYEGTDEYQPIGCDRYNLPGVNPDSEQAPTEPVPLASQFDPDSDTVVSASGVRLHVERWTAERRIFDAESSASVQVALRLVAYPAWEARLDGAQVPILPAQNAGEIVLALSPGAHRVELRFRRTWDRTAGGLLSAFAAIALVFCVCRRRLRLNS